ncbi:trichosurin-like [Trichosurus vulpecula]|uniref:trichosurin-like n=1 Tax=Trichosurus vulpecula TaxID=9337 RepID=UPI00186B2BC9|nr:trichosurin-like [Trichosurus vulpecula]
MKQMKLLLLIMGLALIRGIKVHSGRCKEHRQNISGSWRTIAVASNDTSKIQEGGPFRISVHKIVASGNKLYLEFMGRKNGKCSEIVLKSYKTDKENQYVSEYSGVNIFYFTHIKQDEYIVLTSYNYNENGVTLVLHLFARRPVLREEIKEKFEEFCLNNKINEILYLTRDDQCEKLTSK